MLEEPAKNKEGKKCEGKENHMEIDYPLIHSRFLVFCICI